jgi:hypothetical protein
LSDDAGGGNPLGFASKVHAAPRQDEVSRLDDYIKYTLYGIKTDTAKPPYRSLQVGGDPNFPCDRPADREGGLSKASLAAKNAVTFDEEGYGYGWGWEHDHTMTEEAIADVKSGGGGSCDGIRMTMFYYDDLTKPTANSSSGHFDWNYTEFNKCHLGFGGPTWCMTENMADATYRGFNYPHHTASYWAMYHVARNYDKLKTAQPWQWYLRRAGLSSIRPGSPGTGVMDGTVFREVLNALKAEGAAGDAAMQTLADTLDKNMLNRQKRWEQEPYPYGSEFGFDTTGQEEVVVWNMVSGLGGGGGVEYGEWVRRRWWCGIW